MDSMKLINRRNLFFIGFSVLTLLIFYPTVREIVGLALYKRLYAHMMIVPFVSAYLLFLKRKEIVSQAEYSIKAGTILSLIGISLFWLGEKNSLGLSQGSHLSLSALSALIFWIGGFVLIYGVRAFRVGTFPLLFLLFMVPIPRRILETIVFVLTYGSAEAAYGYFKLTGVPILREGFTFVLPTLTIEVAEQCSGINSSIALFVSGVVAAQLFLRTGWKKIVLVLSIFPVTILKNGLRIVTLTLLGAYVDPAILSGDLHRKGGIPFFIIALAMMAPILWLLRRSEKSYRTKN
jgi:exosortase